MSKCKRDGRPTMAGQTLVEFAFALPILFALCFGTLDFGRAIWYYNGLAEATREGTRYAIVHGSQSSSPVGPGSPSYTAPYTDTVVTGVVRSYAFGMNPSQVTVQSTWPNGDNDAGHSVKVEARFTFTPLTSDVIGGAPVVLDNVSEATIVH